MTAELLILINASEIERAEKLGIASPVEKKIPKKIVMNIHDISLMYETHDNTIIIENSSIFYELNYNKDVWLKIENAINKKEQLNK